MPGLRRWPSARSQKSKSPSACSIRRVAGRPGVEHACRAVARFLGNLRPAFPLDQTVRLLRPFAGSGRERLRRSSGQPRARPSSIHAAVPANTSAKSFVYCRATRSRSAAIRMASTRFKSAGGVVEHVGLSGHARARRRAEMRIASYTCRVSSNVSRRKNVADAVGKRHVRPAPPPAARGASSVPRFVFVPTASRVARTASSTARPTPNLGRPLDNRPDHDRAVRRSRRT